MKLTRREVIKLGLVGSSSLLLPLGYQKQALAQESSSQVSNEFKETLPIPPVLAPVCSTQTGIDGKPTDYYEIEIKKTQQTIGGKPVEIWGYNGITPGPLIRHKVGDLQNEEGLGLRYSVVRFINKLGNEANGEPIKTVVHLHGMASKPEYDGYAEDYIPPDYYKDYIYPNDRAATIWYHDHALHKTLDNVKKGLLGMYIVEDQWERDKLPLLTDGEFDVPLILQTNPDPRGREETLVNGALTPHMDVKRHKYRFRVLNAAPQSIFKLTVVPTSNEANNLTLKVIATDSGLRENPVDVKDLEMGVGERYEFVIDFNEIFQSAVTQVYLKLEDLAFGFTENVLRFNINPDPVADDSVVPNVLRSVRRFENCPKESSAALPSECPAEVTLKFAQSQSQTQNCKPELGGDRKWLINDKGWPEKVACAPAFDRANPTCVNWTLRNESQEIHPVHIHLSDLQIVKRTDRTGQQIPLKPYENNAWKDVFVIKPGETATVAGVFGPQQGIYMMHCHNLKHEDCDMMVTFQVGEDNRDPSAIAPAKPVSEMEPLCPPQPGTQPFALPQQPAYDSDAIIRYNREVYGSDR
ncbi:multicopper oxidase family protein [Scytonema sp. PRP1]|uniref:multicopper oxidase family protein n=1 Tax=Scytonema sp. PRP1 TaxID=3120513 RepID=UPI002FD54EE3